MVEPATKSEQSPAEAPESPAFVPARTTNPQSSQDYLARKSEARQVERLNAEARGADPQPAESPEPAEDEKELEASPSDASEAELQAVETDETDSATEGQDFPESLEALAETLGFDAKDLAEHLQGTVKIDGKEYKVPLREALEGYQRQSDYSRSYDALVKERAQFQSEREGVHALLSDRIRQADGLIDAALQIVNVGPNDAELAQLAQTDPAQYTALKADRDLKMANLNQLMAQRQQLEQARQNQNAQTLAEFRAKEQQALLAANPELKDQTKLEAFETGAADYLTKTVGFSPDEVAQYFNGAFDHRYIGVIRDAMRYRELMGKQSQVKKTPFKPKVAKSTARSAKQRDSEVQNARGRLKSDGSVASGMALLKARRLARSQSNGGSQP